MNLPIQYLRGIAAILVVFAHFRFFPIIKHLCGSIGVDIFFIISGYIMSQTIGKYKFQKTKFFVNRVIRVHTLYIFLTVPLILYKFYIINDITIKEGLFSSLFFMGHDPSGLYKDPLIFSGWSLFYEFVFYTVLALTIGFRKVVANSVLFFLGFVGLIVTIQSSLGYFINSFYLLFFIGYNLDWIKNRLNKKIEFNFTLSVILMLIVMSFNDAGGVNFIPRQSILITLPRYLNGIDGIPSFSFLVPRILFWGLPSLYFTLSFMRYFENRKIRTLKYLGDISYSVYLVHSFLFLINRPIYDMFLSTLLPYNIYIILIFFTIIPISHITYIFIEKRLSNWIKLRAHKVFSL